MVRLKQFFSHSINTPLTRLHSSASGHKHRHDAAQKMLKDTRRLEYKSNGAAHLCHEPPQALLQLRKSDTESDSLPPSTTHTPYHLNIVRCGALRSHCRLPTQNGLGAKLSSYLFLFSSPPRADASEHIPHPPPEQAKRSKVNWDLFFIFFLPASGFRKAGKWSFEHNQKNLLRLRRKKSTKNGERLS